MDIVAGLVLGLIRDVLVQGAGNCIVYLAWRGHVVPDIFGPEVAPSEIEVEDSFFYRVNGERHMYAGPVFAIGIAFWALVAACVLAYVYL